MIIIEQVFIKNQVFCQHFRRLTYDELVKSHIPYVVHASTSSARTEYQ